MTLVSPEPSVLGGGSSRYDFGDEDARVFTDVRVVCAACDAEAQSRVTLDNQDSHHDDHNKNKQQMSDYIQHQHISQNHS